MTDERPLGLDGLEWRPEGVCVYTGDALALIGAVEEVLAGFARDWPAEHQSAPPLLPAGLLERYGYLTEFPHLVTLQASLDPAAREEDGRVLAPTGNALTPAACYHVYPRAADADLRAPRLFRVGGLCFRHESGCRPLARQRVFTMREIVCLGAPADVSAFLERARAAADRLLGGLGLRHEWQVATDPFFSAASPARLAQRIVPSKWEARAEGVAVCSLNHHRSFFAERHRVRAGGGPAASACLAFGVERVAYALVRRHGPDRARWERAAARLPAAG
ncbi:hypothetical protein FAF44_34015 [Nonomuraea sp. MG754425]|uniref:hypothetical protein n=1 Tax=Nonomuraea sp. MG754425 TaxID=2570319 RepID=UPI001F3004FB|nr:hypothetical protein [Nonomuraea sp. MG754425]MCF6473364.1 hypothetical protein [Nonomuraea sp. MG754425]